MNSEATVTLIDGLVVGDTAQKVVELRMPTAGDIIDAGQDSEKVVPTPEGYQLLVSPGLVAQHVLRRQIVRIGTHKGPLTLAEQNQLSARDLETLQVKAQVLDNALYAALEQRGRAPAPG